MVNCVLSVDIGTTSLKAGLISASGEVVAFSRRDFSTFSHLAEVALADEAVGEFIAAFDSLVLQAQEQGLELNVKAIAVSGNGPTIISDKGLIFSWKAEPQNPPETKSLFLPKIIGFREKYPQEFKTTKYLFSGPEYLIWKLTGNAITILPEQRFETAYWNHELLAQFNIPKEKMPPFVPTGANCGNVIVNSSKLYGLPVIAVGPDFVAALIGTNTLESGKLCDRCGSSEGYNFCTSKYLAGPEIRSLPSVIPGLWNASYLIPDSIKLSKEERLQKSKIAIDTLKKLATENGIPFPDSMTATGGQAKNPAFIAEKEAALTMKIQVLKCSDAELLGDACVAWTTLGQYPTLQQAANTIIG